MRLIAANALTTVEVLSPAGEDVGRVVDFMLDTERQSVVYAVVAVGGVLGVGAKMLAIPPERISYDSGRRCLHLSVDTTALAAAPGIDRADAPDDAPAALRQRDAAPVTSQRPRNQR